MRGEPGKGDCHHSLGARAKQWGTEGKRKKS